MFGANSSSSHKRPNSSLADALKVVGSTAACVLMGWHQAPLVLWEDYMALGH